jgi:hypothetical protein
MLEIQDGAGVWSERQTLIIEEHYDARHVIDSCLKNKDGGWCNFPVGVFHTERAHPKGSNYFAMYRHPLTDVINISNAGPSITIPLTGIKIGDTVLLSKYRHDLQSKDGAFIDGGRDYLRCGFPSDDPTLAELVTVKIVGPSIYAVDQEGIEHECVARREKHASDTVSTTDTGPNQRNSHHETKRGGSRTYH